MSYEGIPDPLKMQMYNEVLRGWSTHAETLLQLKIHVQSDCA